jgi:hypothetical protein
VAPSSDGHANVILMSLLGAKVATGVLTSAHLSLLDRNLHLVSSLKHILHSISQRKHNLHSVFERKLNLITYIYIYIYNIVHISNNIYVHKVHASNTIYIKFKKS